MNLFHVWDTFLGVQPLIYIQKHLVVWKLCYTIQHVSACKCFSWHLTSASALVCSAGVWSNGVVSHLLFCQLPHCTRHQLWLLTAAGSVCQYSLSPWQWLHLVAHSPLCHLASPGMSWGEQTAGNSAAHSAWREKDGPGLGVVPFSCFHILTPPPTPLPLFRDAVDPTSCCRQLDSSITTNQPEFEEHLCQF